MDESAVSLRSRWEREHIERRNSVAVKQTTALTYHKPSLDSPLMRGNKNAQRLLSVVSYLPAGISNEAWSSMSLADVELSVAGCRVCSQAFIADSPTPGWITTLEPVRAYMRQQVNDLRAIGN